MRKDQMSMIRECLWIPVVVAIITLGLAVLMSQVQSSVGWKPLVAALAICLTCFSVSFALLVKCVHPVSLSLLQELKCEFRRYASKDAFPDVLCCSQLAEMEEDGDFGEIWLITADMVNETPGKLFNDVVHRNLKRGIQYIYFIPNGLKANARATQVTESHKGLKGLTVVYLPDDFFFLTPRLDFAIYDPWNKKGLRRGYMGLPIDTAEQYHGLMEPELLDTIVGRIGEHLRITKGEHR